MARRKAQDSISPKVIVWSVVASLVASIVYTCVLQPLGSISLSLGRRISSGYADRFLDSVCQAAALPPHDTIALRLEVAYAGLATSSACGLACAVLWQLLRRPNQKPQQKVEAETAEKKPAMPPSPRRRLIAGVLMVTFTSAFAWILGHTAYHDYLTVQFYCAFEQKMTVLAPHIDDLEMKQFRATWASMKGYSDYVELQERLEQLAKEKNVDLPEPTLPL